MGSLCRGAFAPSCSVPFFSFFSPSSETEVNHFNNKSLIGRRSRSSEAARIGKGKESCLKLAVPVTQSLVAQIAGETEEKRGPIFIWLVRVRSACYRRGSGANSDPYRRSVPPRLECKLSDTSGTTGVSGRGIVS